MKKILIAILLTAGYIALLPFDKIWDNGVGLLIDILVMMAMIIVSSTLLIFYFIELANECENELYLESARLLNKPSNTDIQ